ncbi:MAG: signal peptidase II [Armatimonadetes bacterium]|nr:signal peptidase II [Armatimonadota bacterium]
MKRIIFLLAFLVIAADQATKLWMSHSLADLRVVRVIPGLAWELSHNDGAAFGILEGGNLVLIVAAVFAVILLLVWARQANTRGMAVALGLLIGGAVGNLIDRVRLGYVVDFIALQYGGQTVFPNFNLADSAITVGALMLAYCWYRLEQSREDETDERVAETERQSPSPAMSEEA